MRLVRLQLGGHVQDIRGGRPTLGHMPAQARGGEWGGIRLVLQFVVVSACAGVLLAGIVLPLAGTAGYVARSSSEHFERLPSSLATPPLPERSRILAADGSPLATFYSENRIVVRLNRMAPALRDAVIAIEDSRFYKHHGLDVKGTTRALLRNTAAGGVTQGGSTLTQQYVKNVLIESARTEEEAAAAREQSISRKLQELRYAVTLEKRLTKNAILERYLNIAYFGSGAYGAEAASRHYFSKHASELELHEAALLAGVIRAPGAYDPDDNPEDARERRDIVLERMAALGMVSRVEAEQAMSQDLGLKVSEVGNGCSASKIAPLFCDYVYNLIKNEPAFGKSRDARDELLKRGGLTIRTTLQPHVQKAAQRSMNEWTNPKDKVGSAIAMVEPGTGRVRAMAQNHRYGKRTYINYAVDRAYGGSSGFQAGSTFKAFVLATALDQGLPLSLRMPGPSSLTVSGFKDCESGGEMQPYPIVNWESNSYRSLDMREATWRSVNTYYVQLERRTGICEPVNLATKMGVRQATGGKLDYYRSFVLGGAGEVTPLTMAEAYATFAARGKHCDSVAITKVTDRNGKPLDIPRPGCQQVLDREVADAVNSVLEGVISGPDPSRTGAAMDIGRPAAGKTGTTDDTVAVWFAGYTPQLASAVWVGHPKGSISLDNVTIGGRSYASLCGSCLPGPIWRDAMSSALSGRPALDFVEPPPEFRFGSEVTIPDVSRLSFAQARSILVNSGLSFELSDQGVASSVPAGLVAETDPESGTTVAVGTTVTIYLSDGGASRGGRDPGRGGGGPGDGRPPGGGGDGGGGGGPGNGNGKPGKPDKPGHGGG